MKTQRRWALLWRSKNSVDGKREYILWNDGLPLLFHSRIEARRYADERYGYIKERPDLRTEPHGWRMPKAVRVRVSLEEIR